MEGSLGRFAGLVLLEERKGVLSDWILRDVGFSKSVWHHFVKCFSCLSGHCKVFDERT